MNITNDGASANLVRTQLQSTEVQLKALRQASASTGRSVADLIRQGVDQFLSGQAALAPEERIERAIRVAGRFSSDRTDGSANHDRHLADAFRQ